MAGSEEGISKNSQKGTSQQGSANSLSYFGWINTTQENAKNNQFYNWMNVQDASSTKENPRYYDVGTQDNATRNCFPTGMHIQVASHHTQRLLTRIPEKIDQGSSNNLRRLAAVDVQATEDGVALVKKVVKRVSKSTAIGSSSSGSNGNTLAYGNQNTSNTVAFFPTEVNDSRVVQAHAMHGGPQQINLCGVPSTAMARAIIGQSSIVRSAEKISLQDKRDLRFLKRREANRQSAKKSRTMKQALMNELKEKCASLTTEVEVLTAQNEQQVEECQKLRLEVASLKEKLGAAQPGQANGKAERDEGHLE